MAKKRTVMSRLSSDKVPQLVTCLLSPDKETAWGRRVLHSIIPAIALLRKKTNITLETMFSPRLLDLAKLPSNICAGDVVTSDKFFSIFQFHSPKGDRCLQSWEPCLRDLNAVTALPEYSLLAGTDSLVFGLPFSTSASSNMALIACSRSSSPLTDLDEDSSEEEDIPLALTSPTPSHLISTKDLGSLTLPNLVTINTNYKPLSPKNRRKVGYHYDTDLERFRAHCAYEPKDLKDLTHAVSLSCYRVLYNR